MFEQLPISRRTIQHPVRRVAVGNGEIAVRNTMKLMSDVIRTSSTNPYIRNWAEHFLSGTQNDQRQRVSIIFQSLKESTTYIRDIDGMEFIKTPIVSLQLMESGGVPMLDCDDYVVLSLSLLKSVGFPVMIRAAAYQHGNFEHVYGMVKVKEQWIPLDLTQPYGPGWEGPGATRLIDMEVK